MGAVFPILQHADHTLQKRMLPQVRTSVELGEIRSEALALLTDRVLAEDGEPQRYGTQAEIVDGAVRFSPIEDEAHVDERRAELGMTSLEHYRAQLEKIYAVDP